MGCSLPERGQEICDSYKYELYNTLDGMHWLAYMNGFSDTTIKTGVSGNLYDAHLRGKRHGVGHWREVCVIIRQYTAPLHPTAISLWRSDTVFGSTFSISTSRRDFLSAVRSPHQYNLQYL